MNIENLSEKELLDYLRSIDNKFISICDLIKDIDKDLKKLDLDYINSYRSALETLKSTTFLCSDYIFSALDKNDLLENNKNY